MQLPKNAEFYAVSKSKDKFKKKHTKKVILKNIFKILFIGALLSQFFRIFSPLTPLVLSRLGEGGLICQTAVLVC